MAIIPVSGRRYQVTTANNGDTLDLGPASASGGVGTYVVQFNPSPTFVGAFAVLARAYGKAAQDLQMPALPVAYRRVNVAGAGGDYALSIDLISAAGIIQVPANGLAVLLLVQCTQGSCDLALWDLDGPSSV